MQVSAPSFSLSSCYSGKGIHSRLRRHFFQPHLCPWTIIIHGSFRPLHDSGLFSFYSHSSTLQPLLHPHYTQFKLSFWICSYPLKHLAVNRLLLTPSSKSYFWNSFIHSLFTFFSHDIRLLSIMPPTSSRSPLAFLSLNSVGN